MTLHKQTPFFLYLPVWLRDESYTARSLEMEMSDSLAP